MGGISLFGSEVLLTWQDNSTNEAGFKIERRIEDVPFSQNATTTSNVATYVDIAVNANTTYDYRVKAFNSAGDSAYSNTAIVVVPPGANQAPTISNIADQFVLKDSTTGPLAFTIGDNETSAASLVVSGVSSNLSLVTNSGIVFSGAGANRTVTIAPVNEQTGTSTITISVSDGTLSVSDVFLLTVDSAFIGSRSFANTLAITIPNSGAVSLYPSTINVIGMSGSISDVIVTLSGVTHTNPDDLDILLVSPDGQKLLLMSDAGGTGNITNVTFTFSDAASGTLSNSGQLSSGTFRPSNYDTSVDTFPSPAPAAPFGSTFSIFDGALANGVWSLYIRDDASFNSGSIAGWELTVTTVAGSAPAAPSNATITNP